MVRLAGAFALFAVAIPEQVELDHENFPREAALLPVTAVLTR